MAEDGEEEHKQEQGSQGGRPCMGKDVAEVIRDERHGGCDRGRNERAERADQDPRDGVRRCNRGEGDANPRTIAGANPPPPRNAARPFSAGASGP